MYKSFGHINTKQIDINRNIRKIHRKRIYIFTFKQYILNRENIKKTVNIEEESYSLQYLPLIFEQMFIRIIFNVFGIFFFLLKLFKSIVKCCLIPVQA